jgi:hypothetical protein
MLSTNFSLQNDKSVDFGGHAQLTSGIWGYHQKQLLFLQQPTTYFVLLINNLVKTDCSGKPALMQSSVMEKVRGFIANVNEVDPKNKISPLVRLED